MIRYLNILRKYLEGSQIKSLLNATITLAGEKIKLGSKLSQSGMVVSNSCKVKGIKLGID